MVSPIPVLLSGLLLVLPTGVVLGVLTERVALLPPLKRRLVDARQWSAAVKAAVAVSVVWFLLGRSGFLRGGVADPSAPDGDALPSTEVKAVIFAAWITCFCAGACLGSALQPVGITGGIACGKSTVSSKLREGDSDRGRKKVDFAIVDTDEIAHDILLPEKMGTLSAYGKVLAAFGNSVLEDRAPGTVGGEPREIDRRKLGDIVFRDPMKRRRLNAITHPLITKVMLIQIVREGLWPSRSNTSVVAVDVPLLYEVGYPVRFLVGLVVVVACAPSLQLERLMKRNTDLTKEQCEKRIESQMPIDQKVKMADFVVWNNGSMEELEQEVEKVRREISSRVNVWGLTLPKLVMGLGVIAAVSRLFFARNA